MRETLEILVVDNGSQDGTRAVTESFAGIQTLTLPKNFGATKALNIGIRTAKGEFVLLMGPEWEFEPNAIEQLAAQLEGAEDIGAVSPFTDRWYRLPSGDELKAALVAGELPQAQVVPTSADVVAVDYPRGAPMMIRRRFLVGMNYFDERFGEHWWDLELCWQIRNAGKRIVVMPRVHAVHTPKPASDLSPVESADIALGAARFLGKHGGAAKGLTFRLAAMATSLGSVVTMRRPSFHFSRLTAILGGQKIDGTQS